MLVLVLVLDIEHYHITASVSHLTCPCHHISQSFDLPIATTSSVRASASARDRASTSIRDRASTRHRALAYHCISQSFDLPTATISVSHLTCPLLLHHCITMSLHYYVIMLVSHLSCPLPPHQSVFDLPTATTLVSLLTCPLPQLYCITPLLHQ